MRKLMTIIAATALTAGLVAAPGVAGKGPKGPKGAKQVPASVTVQPASTAVTPTTTTVTVTGNVAASSGCRSNRTVRFSYSNGTTVTPQAVTAVTGPNGDYTAVLPKPADVAPASVTITATVDEAVRKVGSKKKGKKAKKGRQFLCLAATGTSVPLSVTS